VSVPRRSGSARPGGRLADIGQDYERGHLDYVQQLDSAGRAWLRTKPFSAPPNEELALCLRTFAHVVELLQLAVGAEVLDVGCGPGWLSEFLARCGYRVTGIDISPDMVEIASARVAALGEIGVGLEAQAEFHAMPVRELPWSNRFDAAILYDTMHHFDDELATLEVIRRTLVPGGQLFIHALNPSGGANGEPYAARVEATGDWRADGTQLVRELTVTNTGSSRWSAAQWYPFPHGSVTLGPYLPRPGGRREVELPRVTLPSAPAPGESTTVELRVPRDSVQGRDAITVDLVREGVCWFGDIGSEPLVLPVPT